MINPPRTHPADDDHQQDLRDDEKLNRVTMQKRKKYHICCNESYLCEFLVELDNRLKTKSLHIFSEETDKSLT